MKKQKQHLQKVGRRHKLAMAHLQAPERQIGYCTPVKTVAYIHDGRVFDMTT